MAFGDACWNPKLTDVQLGDGQDAVSIVCGARERVDDATHVSGGGIERE